jgi:hypothetical protein
MESWNHEAIEIKECVTLGETNEKFHHLSEFFTVSETCWMRNCQNDREGISRFII